MLATPENKLEQTETSDNSENHKGPPGLILHRVFFSDPKTIRLTQKVGTGGAFQILNVWSWCIEGTGYLERENAEVVGMQFGVPPSEMASIIEAAKDVGLLHETDDGKLFHPTILEYRAKYLNKKSNYIKARREREKNSQPSNSEFRENSGRIHAESSSDPLNSITFSSINIRSNKEGGAGETKPLAPARVSQSGTPGTPGTLGTARLEPEPIGELEQFAESWLEPPESEAIKKSRVYMTTGRRPLKKYPHVWLSRPEFVQMLEHYRTAGVIKKELSHLLQIAEAKCLEHLAKGANPETKPAFLWLTGWILEEYLKKRKARMDVERSEQYLTKSMGA